MSNDNALTGYLWPIICEMIKTATENKQNFIVEGCYITFDWHKYFEKKYRYNIRYYCLVMSEKYIKKHFYNIKKYANVIENRMNNEYCTVENVLNVNVQVVKLCQKHDDEYHINIHL